MLVAAIPNLATASPVQLLQDRFPQLFSPGDLTEAAAAGAAGARLVRASTAASALGLRNDDVVLRAGGMQLDDVTTSEVPPAPAAEFVVWRFVPGERPVLEPAILGSQTLDEFEALPLSERSSPRLAVMLANRLTLVRDGTGVVLVPQPAPGDSAAWQRLAVSLPPVSEAALQEVVRAMGDRVAIPAAPDELTEARARLAEGDYLEAEERARRAMLSAVADPARRTDRAAFDGPYSTWSQARTGAAIYQAKLLQPEPLFGFLAEGRVGRIQAFIPQHTLLDVENSTSVGFAAGIRVGWPFGSMPFVDDLSLVVEYGQTRNEWEGPRSVTEANPPTVPILDTTVHEVNFELLYRPRLASRLKPFLRAGIGVHTADADIYEDGVPIPAFDRTAPAYLFGGGVDIFRWSAANTRVSIGGSYRISKFEFLQDLAPNIEPNSNTFSDLPLDVDGRSDIYRFDLSGWQVGLVIAIDL